MEYIIEQFDIDMRKASLYSKNAYAQYEFAIEEAFLESGDLYDTEYIITEAAGSLIEKIKAVFKKIIEAIKKFFQGLFEKIKSIFTSDKETAIKEAIEKNPQIKNEKVQVPDIKEINEVCGKRFILRKKMIAEGNKGTLTRDKFNQMIEHHEALGKKMKTVAIITVTVAALAGGIFAISKTIGNRSKHVEDESISDLNGLQNTAVKQVKEEVVVQKDEPEVEQVPPAKEETKRNKYKLSHKSYTIKVEQVPPTEVAQVVSSGVTEDERTKLLAERDRYIALYRKLNLAWLRSKERLEELERRSDDDKRSRYLANIKIPVNRRDSDTDDAYEKIENINTQLGLQPHDSLPRLREIEQEYNSKYLKYGKPVDFYF